MSTDATYSRFQHYGTSTERAAFTPAPPTLAGAQPIYIWKETDTLKTLLYDTTWTTIANAASTTGVGTTGTINVGSVVGFSTPNLITSVVLGGDLVGSTNSTSVALATTGVIAGTYGTTTEIPRISVDDKGRLTTVSTVAVSIPTNVVGTIGTINTGSITAFSTISTLVTSGALSGDVTSGTNNLVTTLSTTGVSAGAYGDSSHTPVITIDAKGRISNATTAAIGGSTGIGDDLLALTYAVAF